MPLKPARGVKMDVRFLYGVFRGARTQTDECITGTAERVVRDRPFQLFPQAEKSNAEEVFRMDSIPVAPNKDEFEQPMPL